MMKRQAIFRFDFNEQIGAGHLVRCTHIANALRDGGWITTAAVAEGATDIANLRAFHSVLFPGDILRIESVGGRIPAPKGGGCYELVIVDSYELVGAFRHLIDGGTGKLMRIVDWPQQVHDADIIVDVSSGSVPEDYSAFAAPESDLLLGPDYAVQAPEFLELRPIALARHENSKRTNGLDVFVSFGLSDTADLCAAALRVLDVAGGLVGQVHVALSGQSSQALEAMYRTCGSNGTNDFRERFQLHPDSNRIAALMADSDIAIGACGMTSWERCCLGLPAIACALSHDQEANADRLARAGAVARIGNNKDSISDFEIELRNAFDDLAREPLRRTAMSRAGAAIIDGCGLARILTCMKSALTRPTEALS